MPGLSSQDRKIVQKALSALPARINQAKEKEMGDMMGKLKEVMLLRILNDKSLILTSLVMEY